MDKKSILLVEDNADDEALAIRALQKSNTLIDITVVRDGQEALDFLFCESQFEDPKAPNLPDLILLDLKIPKIDGISILKKIRNDPRTRHLVVVILTSSREQRDLLSSYAAGANSYIRKPLDFSEFTEITRQICRYWLTINELPGRPY